MNRRHFLASSLLATASLGLRPSWSEGPWEKLTNPITDSGLVLNPRLLTFKGKVTLIWSGTNASARQPELMYCNTSEDDPQWSKTRAPFFGNDMGRVRRLAIATARDSMALVFQRETSQGNGAVEVLLSLSSDSGYSFSTPFVLDSYVLGKEGGSYLSCAARQGLQRPEFAALWVAEGGLVRVASIDPRSGSRPRAMVVGSVESIRGKAEVIGAGADGFYGIWPEGAGLKTARIHPLTGTIDNSLSLTSGDFRRNFGAASFYRGPALLYGASESGEIKTFMAKEGKITSQNVAKFPCQGRLLDSRACWEREDILHLVVVESGNQPRLGYLHNKGGTWSTPEWFHQGQPEVPVTGFDITVTENYCWAVVSQEQLLSIYRRRLG